jgi:glycosyltransferase involved in cell wall biosynthesis
MTPEKKILFIVPYPLHRAPSQRFRVELYFQVLDSENIGYTVAPFLDEATWNVLYQQSSILKKAWGVLRGYVKRFKLVFFGLNKYDYIFIHREASPLGPPIFEWIISRVRKKKYIYDYDDAIWIPDSKSSLLNWVKAFWKIRYLCKWAFKVAGGNEFLCNYASQFNQQVVLLPTSVDIINHHNRIKEPHSGTLVIGWTGSHSTLKYLDQVIPVLERISGEFSVEIFVIANKPPAFRLPNLQFIKWTEASEIEDLMHFDIGIMPLEADQWSEGKCGFKLIQYLALGIPAVASPVGVNTTIIEKGQNGFLARTEEEWYTALKTLISDAALRKKMGESGRQKIIDQYSIQANAASFLQLFHQ